MNTGKQPCASYAPPNDTDFYVHECPVCLKRRYECDNCHRDHHEDGWDTCHTSPTCEVCGATEPHMTGGSWLCLKHTHLGV